MTETTAKYEAIIVLNLQGEEGVDAMINAVGQELETEGAKLDQIDKMGRKEFAYNARKQAAGYYVNYYFHADTQAVAKIQQRLRIHPDVYLQYYSRLDA